MNQITHIGLSLLGYSRGQVERLIEQKDNKLRELEQQVTTLNDQVAQLTQSLAKYTEMEQALKDGIVDARITGNQIVKESTEEAHRIVEKTNTQVTQYKEEFASYSHELVSNGSRIKHRMNDMKHEMLSILEEYQKLLNETDFDAIYPEKEVARFDLQVSEYLNDDSFGALTPAEVSSLWHDSNLSDEEKQELKRLIDDVISNEDGTEVHYDTQQKVSGSDHSEAGEHEVKKTAQEQKLVRFTPKKHKKR